MYHSRIVPRPCPWKQAVVTIILTVWSALSSKAQNCQLYPIALSTQTLSNAAPGAILSNVYNGTQPGNFGWLSWGGSPSEPTLVTSLTPPGDSPTYINPDDPGNHRLVVGDWVSSKPGVSNSKNVRDALNNLETIIITVPVWDDSRGQGASAAYRISGFANIRILSYQLPGQNQITAQFLGYADCGSTNQPPAVNAGPDQTITLPASASLSGLITDDGLPSGGQLMANWSEVSGPGTVTFSNPSLTAALNGTPITNPFPTTVTFPSPGTYVLELTASDSQFTSSNNLFVTVDRPENPPIAYSQSVALDENTSTNIVLQGSDPDGDPISFTVTTLPNYGKLSGTPPNLTYTAIADYSGQDSFTFKTFDGLLSSSNATVSITISPVIVPPVADAEIYTNDENTSLPITLSGSDVQGKPLTFQILTNPVNGTLSGTPPNLIYSPASNYFGPDSLTFKDNNGVTDSAPAVISLTVMPVDEPPLVDAGSDQLIIWPTNAVSLAGSITYWVYPGTVDIVQWTEVSGPGKVVFANPSNEVTTATFSQSGLYELQLVASDGFLSGTDAVAVTVDMPPTVSAGPNQTNTLPNTITLNGTASDDGLPTNGVLTVAWSFVSGPGSVIFSNPNQTNTTVSFSQSGVYDLRLTANDGVVSVSSDVTNVANQAPIVDAGSDQTVTNLEATLNGTVFDDGLPNGTLLTNWSQVSGPGVATFANSNSATTTVTFSQTGVYVLQLTANDSIAQSSAEVTITVDGAPVVSLTNEFIVNWPSDQLTLNGTVTDDGLPTGGALNQVWTQIGGPGTISFAPAVQINALAGTAITNVISTTATASAPGLYTIQLTADDGLATNQADATLIFNQAPTVNAGSNQVVTFPQAALLNGVATDDGLPIGQLTYSWIQISGPGVATFANPSTNSTSVSFSAGGVYVLQLSANDSAATGSAQVTILANISPVAQSQTVTVVEDSSTNIMLQASDTDGDLLSFAIVTPPQNGTLSQVSHGQYLYTPAATYFGSDSFTFKANDGYVDSAPATVTLTVLPRNHPPTFTTGSNQAVVENAGAQTVVGWASNISPGPADESSQTVQFLVNSDNPGLFSAGPSIASNGTLNYTPVANANGIANITVQAQDNGGTANGGVDTSAPQTFAITIVGPPVVSVPGSQTVGDALPLVFDTNRSISVSDAYVGQGAMQLSVSVSNGALTFSSTNGLSFLSGTNGSSSAVVTGTLSNLNASLLNLTYASILHYSGTDTLSLAINDLGNNRVGTPLTASNRVSISVFRTNHPPVFVSTPVTNATAHVVHADGMAQSIGVTNVFNLGTWTDIQYGPFGEGPADWVLSNSNTVVNQVGNSDASVFVGPTTFFRDQVHGSFGTSDTSDNDFIGFVFGYQNSSNYYLFDWKQGTELVGVLGEVGMSVKVITASPQIYGEGDLWATYAPDPQVAHTLYHNSIPYVTGATYQFTLNFQPGDFTIQVSQGSNVLANIELFDSTYGSGKFGFYNFSQADCNYSGFSDQPLAADSYVYPSLAIDPDGDPVTYSLVSAPTNMTINATNGLIQWYPYTNFVGNYQVTIQAADNHGGTTLQTFTVNVPPPIINKAPFVSAGPERAFTGTNTITLNGVVVDDGIPTNTPLVINWSKAYGPGTVTFGNSNSPVTTATFSTNGVYVLQLNGSDTLDSSNSFVTVRANDVCSVEPPSGLVAWWPATLNTQDSVTGVAATSTNLSFSTGLVGPAFSFDGATTIVDAPAQPAYNVGSNGFTVEYWMIPNNYGQSGVLGWANGVRVERTTTFNNGDTLHWSLTGTNAGQYLNSSPLWGTASWSWTHVALTYDPSSGLASLYINGLLNSASNVGTNLLSTAGDFYLGQVPGTAGVFTGMLDEVTIYSRPLNPEEVYNIFAAGAVGKCPDDGDAPPAVYAGPDLFVTGVPGVATLAGQVTDKDGLPADESVNIQWSQLGGPGTVTFANSNSATTTATFSSNGVYVLQLTANDGEAQSSDLVEVRVEALCTVNDPQGLAAWWPANGSEVEALHGYPAYMIGAGGYANGMVGAAFNFDGSDDYIDFPAQTNYDIASSPAGFSIEFWMNAGAQQSDGIMGWSNSVRFERFNGAGSGGGDSLHCYIGGTSAGQYLDGIGVCRGVGNWIHLVLTYDRILGAACLYANGVLYSTNYAGTNVMSTAGDFYMGHVPGSPRYFPGRLDEVSLYSRPLTVNEVGSLYASGSTGKCPDNGNTGPTVSAGPDQFITGVPGTAILNGQGTDDGLPSGSTLHFQWSKLSGPGPVSFANSGTAVTSATFGSNGVYVLQLTADDGEMQANAQVEVRVEALCNATDPAGLVAWWPLNDNVQEVMNGYNDAVLYNLTGFTNGEVAGALNFNGVNNYVLMPAHTNYDVGQSTNGFTVEFWMNVGLSANSAVLGWANGVRMERLNGAGAAGGDSLRCYITGYNTTGAITALRVWPNPSTYNLWYHFAFTYDRTLGLAKSYVNGVLNSVANLGTNVMSTAGDFYMGEVPGSGGAYNGKLDEVSVYARPLNSQEVLNLYNSGSVGKCPENTNAPPVVSAGPDMFVVGLPGVVTLHGQASDDGLPAGSTLQTAWSVVSGSGTVTFANSNSLVTSATFSTNGIYVLQLTANDGEYQSSSFVEARVDSACVAQDPAGLVAWWPADNNTMDIISGKSALDANGGGYTNGEVGEAFQLNGGDYIVAPASSNYDIGTSTNGFTVEFWEQAAVSASFRGVFSWNNVSTNGSANGVLFYQDGSSANGTIVMVETNGTGHQLTPNIPGLFNGSWHHVALTYDRPAGLARVYVDTVLQVQQSIGSFQPLTSYDLVFGQVATIPLPFLGQLDEVSLYRRPLTQQEIINIYQSGSVGKCPENPNQPPTVYAGPDLSLASTNVVANLNGAVIDDGLPIAALQSQWSVVDGPGMVTFANPNSPVTTATFSTNGIYTVQLTANDGEQQGSDLAQVRVGMPCGVSDIPGLVAWWTGNSNTLDNITGVPAVLANGAGYSNGVVASCFQLGGTNDYISIAPQTNYDIGRSTNGFTVEFWEKTPATTTRGIWSWNNTSTGGSANGVLLWENGSGTGIFNIPETNGNGHSLPNLVNLFNGNWKHVALTYDRVAGVAKAYVNGVLQYSQAIGSFQAQTSYELQLGRVAGFTSSSVGDLDEFSLYTRPLTQSEIQSIFNAGALGKCVTPSNRPPVVSAGPDQIISFPTNSVTLNGVVADDGLPSNTLAISWTYVSGNSTAFFSSTNTPVTTVTFTNTGTYIFQLSASDGQLSTNATTIVNVLPDTRPRPVVSVTGPADGSLFELPVGGTTNLTITATASSADAPITNVEFLLNGASVGSSTTAPYSLKIPDVAPAPYTITAVAMAADGLSTTSAPVTVNIFVDDGPPVVGIFAPLDSMIVTAPTNIIGTASSDILQSWQVRYRLAPPATNTDIPIDSAGWGTLATGSTSVMSNTLAVFDPTMLLNGIYQVQIIATDLEGRSVYSDPTTLVVDRNLKIGNFTVSFTDLSVPVPGLPIQITRTYDTRAAAAGIQGDFGLGWTMDIHNVRLQKNRPLGSGWTESVSGDIGLLSLEYDLDPGDARIVTITFPDGRVEQFELVPNPVDQLLEPIQYPQWHFVPIGNTQGTLVPSTFNAVDGNFMWVIGDIPGTVDLYDLNFFSDNPDATSEVLNDYPTSFRYTSPEGYNYVIDEIQGLQSATDPNGNTLLISTNGLTWTNSAAGTNSVNIAFQRDGQGRITNIVDAVGQTLQYAYSTNGNLVSFTDSLGNTNGFAYTNASFPNYLTGIINAQGVMPMNSEYDSNGRLVGNTDVYGNSVQYINDPTNLTTTVIDRNGNALTQQFDANGNLIESIDALGGVTSCTYDDQGRRLSRTNPLGQTERYVYDPTNGALIAVVNALLQTNTFEYNAQGQVTLATERDGTPLTADYDSGNNVTRVVDTLGNATTYAYTSVGKPYYSQDALGNVTLASYDASGNLLRSTNALGHVSQFAYDGNNRITTQVLSRTNNGVLEFLTNSWVYNAAGRVTAATGPDGSVHQTIYDAEDRVSVTIDELGRGTTNQYDLLGRLTQINYSDGSSEGYGYDAGDRKIAMTNRLGEVTRYVYDVLNRLVVTIAPDGSGATNVYDAGSRVVATSDARGNTTYFGYDVLNRTVAITNALNQVTTFTYDGRGNQITETDALGRTTTNVFDLVNRVVAVLYPDGTTMSNQYDALGRKVSDTDQSGRSTQYGYDALGRLISVTNAMMQVTRYEFDDLGEQTAQIDASGRITRYTYDDHGRRLSRILPLGQSDLATYDFLGNMTAYRDFNGNTTTYQYDSLNRLLQKTPDPMLGGTPVTYGYNALGQRTNMVDASGTTTYSYDIRDRLIQKATPQGSLSYAYDANGNVTNVQSSNVNGLSIGYEYDALNRLSAVDDARLGRTTYGYDSVGNLQGFVYPNWASTVYSYDSLNRLTNVASDRLVNPLSRYAYTLDPSGHRTSVVEAGGRVVNYAYDVLYQLTNETVSGTANAGSLNYAYDAVGNRLARNSSLPGILANTYSYDANDRLLSDSYDNNGNTRSASLVDPVSGLPSPVTDQYDFENHLINRNGGQIRAVYDGDGTRSRKIVNTATNIVTTYYLVDELNPSGYPQVVEELTTDTSHPPLSTPTVTRVYTWGHSLISQDRLNGSTWVQSFYGYDGQGSVRYLTDANGNITDTYDYDAFGNLTGRAGSTPNNYLYQGEQYDPDLKLYYLRSRYTDPDRGRFWTMDTFEGFGTDPKSLHKYTFNQNDPVNRIDHSGHDSLVEEETVSSLEPVVRGSLMTLQRSFLTCNLQSAAVASIEGGVIGGTVSEGITAVVDAFTGNAPTAEELQQAYSQGFADGSMAGLAIGLSPFTAGIYAGYSTIIAGMDFWRDYNNPNVPMYVKYFEAANVVMALMPLFPSVAVKLNEMLQQFCFPEGTEVATATGQKPIDTIKPGDLVWSQSDETGEVMLKPVKQVFVNVAASLIVLHCGTNTLEATDEHPFWIVNQGWKVAKEIQIGDDLWTRSGERVAVTGVEHRKGQFTVYNFEIDDFHSYFVGDLDFLAHNSGSCNWSIKGLSDNLKTKLMKIWQYGPNGLKQLSGSVSTVEARELAEAFVGPNFTEVPYQDSWQLNSQDGLRQVRGPAPKSGVNPLSGQPYSATGVQMNFEARSQPSGSYNSNVHVDVRPGS